MSRVDCAVFYSRLGYRVLPIEPNSKRPVSALAPRGVHSASDNHHVLRAWFSALTEPNLAIVPPAGVVVLDFDQPGEFSRFLRRWQGLTQAPHSRTPRGGAHLYLRVPADTPLRSRSGRGLPNLEIKRAGREYLLEEPSTTERGSYRWIVPLRAPGALPEMPEDLLNALTVRVVRGNPTPSQTALQDALNLEVLRVRSAAVGSRHNQLVRSAARVGGLIAQGLERERGYTALLEAARVAGLPDAEAIAAISWGLDQGQQSPAPVRELPPRLRLWLRRRERLGVRRER